MAKFRGFNACSCLIKWLPVYEAELLRRGVIKHSIDIYQLIGGAKASAGTHSTGGAFDIGQYSTEAIKVAREMGAATWHRGPAQGMINHAHGVLNGCPHNRPARYQIAALRLGRNGLGWMGLKGRDDGPKPRKLRSWENGIKWAKAQKPKPMRTTRLRVYEQNCNADKGDMAGWTRRAVILAAQFLKAAPHIIAAVELTNKRRPILSMLIRVKYSMTTHHQAKVQYLRHSARGWVKVGLGQKWSLGNGKHAIAQRYRHRTSNAPLVVVTPHLTWQHDQADKRADETETLLDLIDKHYRGLPVLVVGDLNDSHHPTKTRPVDTAGRALKAAGYHDLYFELTNADKTNRHYNTANGYRVPPPRNNVHLDRFFGTSDIAGISWTADVKTGKYGADHWGIYMDIDITHEK